MASDSDNDEKKAQKERQKKKEKNVFTYMESTVQAKSPKCLLYNSIAENRKIKVWTRSHSYVRSICMGYLILFDKYWNLAMIDVDEVYKVPIVKQNEKDLPVSVTTQQSDKSNPKSHDQIKCEKSLMRLNQFSNLTIGENLCKLNSKGYRILHRHVNQLFIRGDNVVMVTYAD